VRRLSTILFICLISLFSSAILPPPNNAVSLSLGGASSCYRNAFAIENNVAVLAFSDNQIYLNGSNQFGLGEYSSLSLAGNAHTKLATIGLSYQISPLGNLTTQKAQIGIAKKLGDNFSAGVCLNYHTLHSTDAYYQSATYLTVSAGIYYKINDKLNSGFQFTNPNRSRLTSSPEERSISLYRLGFEYSVTSDLALYTDFLQATDEPLDLNAGIELKKEKYAIRGGFGLNQLVALGFGWQTNALHIDVAGSFHNQLGFSPSLNVSYAF
jgi:hypothetical protein